MMYLDDENLDWVKAIGEAVKEGENKIVHRDAKVVVLQTGDSVVLIKDLKVKELSMLVKQGTSVCRISLDGDNA